ncbi:spermatogenesis- and oogenesis-specific basic helix-loop-helix-containing protein 1 [Odocoileus virginianus]|uniref:Spermatogenesis- and oogenesis-specific basic helix-loop-helix-containing protein 1 n=1 Tax=Odocoileus virginianus TaxID=9874 RepID=A0A6J0X5H9_ODOVR|nr:spermatogenesis- and oogenesis-specific basic helix-loop-helix-containing protein 1 [Odocoileus virginianus texanus]
MASGAREPRAGVPRVSRGCSVPFPSSTRFCCEDHPSQGSGQTRGPPVAEGPGSRLPRNVLSERERRKRISLSCERLRALLPWFDGRREDMASVLEMAVQFLQLAGTLVPGWEQQAVLASSKEPWLAWQTDVLQLALASQAPAGAPDASAGTSSVMHQTPPSCSATSVDEDEAQSGVADVPDRPLAPPGEHEWVPSSLCAVPSQAHEAATMTVSPSCWTTGSSSVPRAGCSGQGRWSLWGFTLPDPLLASLVESPGLVPRSPGPRPPKVLRPSPLWPVRSQQPPSPLVSEEPRSCLGQAGPPAQGADKALMLDSRSVSGCDVADGVSFLLTPGPDWWLGSLEGRGSGTPSRAAARSSPLDRPEPGFLGDPESGPKEEPLDGTLEPWGSDVSCPSPVLRDEVDSIFPDFFAC